MTDTLKVLGQAQPTINVLTNIYTVPGAAQTTVSSLVICNLSNIGTSFNIAIAIGGASDSLQQYIYYNMPLDSNDTFIATIGMSLAAGDTIRVLASSGIVSFNIFGVEIT